MMAIRGLPGDFEGWKEAGADGWGWDDVLPYFRKLETDQDFPNQDFHGRDGPLPIRRIPREDWPPIAVAAEKALTRQGHEYIEDLNAAPRDGYARVTLNNRPDRRISGAAAYLTHEVRARANLRIVPRTRAVRVLFEGRRAIGVEAEGGEIYRAGAVVLSAGAIQTPALLQRSGVGPGGALQALGIPVIADNPGVGTGLQDHPTAGVGLAVRSDSLQDPALRPNGNMVLRLSSGALSPEHADAPPQDIFMPVYNKTTWHALGQRLGLIQAVLYGPYSRGAVRLRAPDPAATPEVRFNLLDDPRDMARMKTAYRFAAALAAAPELAGLIHGTFPASLTERVRRLNLATPRNGMLAAIASHLVDLSGVTRRAVLRRGLGATIDTETLVRDDDALEAWLRENARGFFHASCSCPMGADDDPMAALDSRCRVRGVAGLRVVDASVMPRITRASTNIQAMMIGERAADLIRADT
jgi:5-(hydroxymethyl)furfural/furfural oxidase